LSNDVLDVAIVGAGVSGLYAGWRLRADRAGPERSVAVFEASERVGGRLLSLRPPGIPNMVAELGGMRILPAVQPRIRRLIEVLNDGCEPGDRIETFDFPVDEDDNIAFLRGTYLRLADFARDPDRVPYRLGFLEKGQRPGGILIQAIEQIVPGITRPGLDEYERRRMAHGAEFDGKPLYQQGFWQVLVRVISGEAYLLALDAGGYQSTLSNWNAADAIPWYLSDFGVDARYKGFRRGFQQVPDTLDRLFREAGGSVRLGAHLTGFEWSPGEALFTLRFRNAPSLRSRALVLAMPRRSLDLIRDGSALLREERVTNLVRSVTPRPLFKLFTTYTCPWWRPAGVRAGRSVTDLPVRQTYYWPTDAGGPAEEGPAMLMASYDDGLNIGFWDGFRPRRGVGWRKGARDVPNRKWFGGEANARLRELREAGAAEDAPDVELLREWLRYCAPAAMVEEVQRQLRLMHGMSFTPSPVDAAFKDWGDDPFGGGWHSWNIGVKSWEVVRGIVEPVEEVPLYVCGEAYSDAQGWVEGALQTADLVLERLGVPGLDAG
jgi:monoamine oxidase